MKLHISDKKGADIRDGMIGLFFEDINYGADGGLHAELIENRSFEFVRATGTNDAYVQEYDGGYGWEKFPKETPFAAMEYRTVRPLTEENPHYLHFRSVRPNLGFTNKAYDGIFLKKDERYRVSFFLRAAGYTGTLCVFVAQDGDFLLSHRISVEDGAVRGEAISVEERVDGWQRVSFSWTAPTDSERANFGILLDRPGEAEFDLVSMIPEDAVCGVFRKDLVELLKALKPGFLRFPGGCVIEGNDLNNRYQWKRSVGAPETRKANWNRWAVHGNSKENHFVSRYPHYNQTLGIGYYEYFLLCEALGAKALPVVNVGLACQYQSKELVETDDPRFQEFIQDALDLIEFANGGEDTRFGALRAEMGHREPFNLEFIGIGNEQWETERVNFFERYTLFERAIHERYPEIRLIGSAGPDVHTERYEAAWNFYRAAAGERENFTYAVDEHYYMPPKWFLEHAHFYDDYPRDVKVFSGEYAAHPRRTGGVRSGNTLLGALSEAAFLTGVERNADVVVMASYAPLLARIGYVQWAPDLIWFDARTAYGTPSYYVQRMYANHMGQYTLQAEIEGAAAGGPATAAQSALDAATLEEEEKKAAKAAAARENQTAKEEGVAEEAYRAPDGFPWEDAGLFVSASRDETADEIIVKLVNVSAADATLALSTDGFAVGEISATLLGGGDLQAFNTAERPERVAPRTQSFSGADCESVTIPANTFGVFRLRRASLS